MAEWSSVVPSELPDSVLKLFPLGVRSAYRLLGPAEWFAVRCAADGKWYAFGPKGLMMTTGQRTRRRWFRTMNNCMATVRLEVEKP